MSNIENIKTNLLHTLLGLEKGRSKKQQDKGLSERVKTTGLGGDYAPTAQTAENYAHAIASSNQHRSKKAQTAIERGGKKGAARHGARAAIAEDYTPSMQSHYEREGSKVGKRAAEMGRENKAPYKKVPKEFDDIDSMGFSF
jgi:hypothetical protein